MPRGGARDEHREDDLLSPECDARGLFPHEASSTTVPDCPQKTVVELFAVEVVGRK